jgi:hypothetical protein
LQALNLSKHKHTIKTGKGIPMKNPIRMQIFQTIQDLPNDCFYGMHGYWSTRISRMIMQDLLQESDKTKRVEEYK